MKKKKWLVLVLMLVLLFIVPTNHAFAKNTTENKTFHYFALGNSLTQHPIMSYWWGLWGMAASTSDLDYYHLVNSGLSKDGVTVAGSCYYFKAWEDAATGSARTALLSSLDSYLTSDLDLVTIQLGENIQNTAGLQSDFETMVKYIKKRSPDAQVIFIGQFWNNNTIDQMKQNVCNEYGYTFINLTSIQGDIYRVGLGTVVSGADGQSHAITNEAVAAHPNNTAMKYIANRVLDSISYTHIGGVDYSSVYDPSEYAEYNSDVANAYGTDKEAELVHFVSYGMGEGRRGKGSFSALSYMDRYPDLKTSFGKDYESYYLHYINSGKGEGRNGSVSDIYAVHSLNGVDYSAVYDYAVYTADNPDVAAAFSGNDILTLKHFIENGMNEGRQASNSFLVQTYMNNYADLRTAFGSNLQQYYMHYINSGKSENRVANDTLYPTVYNGKDYSAVYDYDYYTAQNPDVAKAMSGNKYETIKHFVEHGMSEGRMSSSTFDVYAYRAQYKDLRAAFGEDSWIPYYNHYIDRGKNEGRTATGSRTITDGITSYNGTDYSDVYNYSYYIAKNPDVAATYPNDDLKVLIHFITFGMNEARQSSSTFDVRAYRAQYKDLRQNFGSDWKSYFMHYLQRGKSEGRTSIGTETVTDGITIYNGKDYSKVYNYAYYIAQNPDVAAAYPNDDISVLSHFVNCGMGEGRNASADFVLSVYKAKNPDLVSAFGGDNKSYYLHYIDNGYSEKRIAK